jgi:hypothetical protein
MVIETQIQTPLTNPGHRFFFVLFSLIIAHWLLAIAN